MLHQSSGFPSHAKEAPPHSPSRPAGGDDAHLYPRAAGWCARYIAEHGPWSTFIELRALDSSPPPWLKHWDGDGIISRTFTQETADIIAASGVPAVEIRSSKLCQNLPFVGMDNRLIGRIVAEHFFNRGYRNFAAYSLEDEDLLRTACAELRQHRQG